jgi:hypothetical protein
MHVLTGRNDFGRPISPAGLAGDVLPVPITARTLYRSTMEDDSDKYLWSERMLGLFGPVGRHLPPEGMRLVHGELRERRYREPR